MIRYAITKGDHHRFLKRDLDAYASGPYGPLGLDSEGSLYGSGFLPSRSLLDQVRQLAHDGVDYIQLREKHLPAGELAALARQILGIIHMASVKNGRSTRLLINTRADVAVAVAAHGVHLPATPGSLKPSQVHRLYHSIGLPSPIISKACHTLPEVRSARAQAPDLILFSPVFGKSVSGSPVSPATGLEALSAACTSAHPIPVLALGGVTSANTASCLQAGAAGVAGIRLFQLEALKARQA